MTLKKRYALIILGALIFAVCAPVLIFGIQGYTYDFANRRLVKTGIMVVKTDPKDAKVTVTGNDTIREFESNKTLRFLKPGDYQVKIEKDGYHSWEKRLNVRGGVVTWINAGTENKILLSKNPELVKEERTYTFKNNQPIGDFTYLLEQKLDNPALMQVVGLPNNNPGNRVIVAENIPYQADAKLIPGQNGMVFILLGRTLSQVQGELVYIADGVDFAVWQKDTGKLAYGNPNELNLFNPYDASNFQRELLTRTSEQGGSFCIMPDLGYALRSYGHIIRAIELDGRDKRNLHDFLQSENDLEIVECSNNGDAVAVKDGDSFKTYTLRP